MIATDSYLMIAETPLTVASRLQFVHLLISTQRIDDCGHTHEVQIMQFQDTF